jgi:endoglucanase
MYNDMLQKLRPFMTRTENMARSIAMRLGRLRMTTVVALGILLMSSLVAVLLGFGGGQPVLTVSYSDDVLLYPSEAQMDTGLLLSAVVAPYTDKTQRTYVVTWRYGNNKETPMELYEVRESFAVFRSTLPIDLTELNDDLSITYTVREREGAVVATYTSPVAVVKQHGAPDVVVAADPPVATASSVAAVARTPAATPRPAPAVVPTTTYGNPLAGLAFYTHPDSSVAKDAAQMQSENNPEAALLTKVAAVPAGIWLTAGRSDIGAHVRSTLAAAQAKGQVPLFVVYYHPTINCWDYNEKNAAYRSAYLEHVETIGRAIGGARAVVVWEPDATALKQCIYEAPKEQNLFNEAIGRFVTLAPNTTVYLDAGHAVWISPAEMANRLLASGIEHADGFAVNVSNFIDNGRSIAYGTELSRRVGGKHFVVDTARNGNGPTSSYEWCNPRGRALGTKTTGNTGHALVDGLLWIKPPGESDGTCNGGPREGAWWREYALEVARNAGY